MPQRGFRIIIQRITDVTPGQSWLAVVLVAELLVIAAIWIIPWNRIFAAPVVAQLPVAHAQPLALPTPTATPDPPAIQINANGGAVCVVPTGKAVRIHELVKVP